jgi:tetratricopeptide (TPR) repeat protein
MTILPVKIYYLIIVCLCLLTPNYSWAQQQGADENVAIEYFKEKKFEKALPLFAILINQSPDNAMYNYYYGVTLLKNNKFETATKEALLNAVVDKTPSNANFYLGNYFHGLGNWSEALDFYKRFKGTKQEREGLEYDKYVNLCQKHINPFKVDKGDTKQIFTDTIKVPAPQPDEKIFPIPDSLKTAWFNFQINDQLTYHSITDFRSEAARILFAKAWIATGKNDSIVINTDILRKTHEESNDVSTRLALVQRIVDAEQQSYQLLRDREKYFEQARVKETRYWEKISGDTLASFIAEIAQKEQVRNNRLVAEIKKIEVEPAEVVSTLTDTIAALKDKEVILAPEAKIKPSQNEVIIFKVQIGSFLNGKLTPAFKAKYDKLSKFRKIDKYRDQKNYEIYTIGNFTVYKDATMLKNQLIMEGLKGAFLAAFKNGERVPVSSVVKETPIK